VRSCPGSEFAVGTCTVVWSGPPHTPAQGAVLSEKLRTRIETLRQFAKAKLDTRLGRVAQHGVRWGIPLLLFALVGYGLTRIGWSNIYASRPESVLFYLVLALPFFVQPIGDLILYRYLLGVGRALPLWIFLRKRYMNTVMLDYSGEVYLFFWIRKRLKIDGTFLIHAVKDSSVLSAAGGLVVLWLMFMILLVEHLITLPSIQIGRWPLLLIGSVPLLLGIALFVGNRKLTALSRKQIAVTFSIHLTRCIASLALEFVLWWLSGALPTSGDCFKFVALRLLVTRLPLIPSKDLVFVGVAMAAVGTMAVSAPKVAAVLVLMTVIDKIEDIVVVGGPWLFQQARVRRSEAAS
jgi:hypothetical protein